MLLEATWLIRGRIKDTIGVELVQGLAARWAEEFPENRTPHTMSTAVDRLTGKATGREMGKRTTVGELIRKLFQSVARWVHFNTVFWRAVNYTFGGQLTGKTPPPRFRVWLGAL